jgi:hypothetical protein
MSELQYAQRVWGDSAQLQATIALTHKRLGNVRAGNFVETAKVLAVMKDGLGIPHVRFDMTVDTPSKIRLVEGRRILSLASFTQLYRERVPA